MLERWIKVIINKLDTKSGTISTQKVRSGILSALPFWIASIITGLVAVGYTRLFNYSEHLLNAALAWHRWLIFILAPAGMLLGWYLVRQFAPGAGGSGIPQVMAAIELPAERNDKAISRLLSIRVVITKITSSMAMVVGGAAIGREGPTIQIAGSIFRTVHKLIPASWPRLAKQNFIITGAAAGLAAAFNTPLGGIVFAIEELARIHVSFFRSALFTAVILAGLTAQAFLGPYLYLGYPDVGNLRPLVFLSVVAVAIIAGLLASLMCRWILALTRWRSRLSGRQTILFILGVGLTIATLAYFTDAVILGSGKEVLNETLFTKEKHLPLHTIALRIIGPVLSFNTGAAGGVFAPSLAAGASIGAWFSGAFGFIGANANILILAGMVGFLTGVTRSPFTSAILVLEMTDRHSVIFHLMTAALIANIIGKLIDSHSLYDQLKERYLKQVTAESKTEGPSDDPVPPAAPASPGPAA